jgi:hypothetical protein
MTREDFIAVQKRFRESWNGSVTLERKAVERMLDEIRWLKRRLRRVEHVLEPLIEALGLNKSDNRLRSSGCRDLTGDDSQD